MQSGLQSENQLELGLATGFITDPWVRGQPICCVIAAICLHGYTMEQRDSSGAWSRNLYLGQLSERDWWELIQRLGSTDNPATSVTEAVQKLELEEPRSSDVPQDPERPESDTAEDRTPTEVLSEPQQPEELLAQARSVGSSSSPEIEARRLATRESPPREVLPPPLTSFSRLPWAAVVSGGRGGVADDRHQSVQSSPSSEKSRGGTPPESRTTEAAPKWSQASAPKSPGARRRLWRLLEQGTTRLGFDSSSPEMPQGHSIDPHWRRPGFANMGNSCYLNAVLQALLAIDEFRNTWAELAPLLPPETTLVSKHRSPLVAGWLRLVKDWLALRHQSRPPRGRPIPSAGSLQPTYFWESERLAAALRPGHQEDAQELLMVMLDGLHNEVLDLLAQLGAVATAAERTAGPKDPNADAADNAEWEMVDRKGRSAIVRTHEMQRTFVTALFGGALRSEVRKTGAKRSAVCEPFLMLSLNIDDQRIRTLDDAFRYFMEPEFLDTPESGTDDREAAMKATHNPDLLRKHVTLDTPLPPVLIIHLKRFTSPVNSNGQSKKLTKSLSFPLQLSLSPSWFSAAVPKAQLEEARARRYRLVAVITHLGPDLASGHYIADVLASRPAASRSQKGRVTSSSGSKTSSAWLNEEYVWWQCDDLQVQSVPSSTVLSRAAYLLVYRT